MNLKKIMMLLSVSIVHSIIAVDLWYVVPESGERSWDNVLGWKSNSGMHGALPKNLVDNVSLNNEAVSLPNFLRVTNGVLATAYQLRLGSIEGAASYWESGRKIALKVESGGVLHTDARTVSAISLGDVVSGYGMMMIEGGTVSNEYITVGRCGIGILHHGTEYTTSVYLQS